MKEIDARGLQCPQPVILTKKALEEIGEGQVMTIVDNYIAKENVSRLAANLNLKYFIEEKEDLYFIKITKDFDSKKEIMELDKDLKAEEKTDKNGIVIVIEGEKMGSGDDVLGDVLMKSYIYALTEVSPLPKTVIFLNGGVRLVTEGSAVLDSVMKLDELGVEIISCGTCLDYYGLNESLKVGLVGNMYSIVEAMHNSEKTIIFG
ncbi:MAG: sulfurtransferase-like selenium metabolism protein YedF [Firmicutes bacterium]|nr:sulfurtransferase-like selenium metabolism protein YedF [Bacillota bacterium]